MVSIYFFAMAFDCMVFVVRDFVLNSSAQNHAVVVMFVVAFVVGDSGSGGVRR